MLLVPVQFKQVSPNSGFDWVSQPHWLMVPAGGTNQAIAVTPASSHLAVNFSVEPSSPNTGTTISPANTSSSNQTITVSGTSDGNTTQVQAGIGITTMSRTIAPGLASMSSR